MVQANIHVNRLCIWETRLQNSMCIIVCGTFIICHSQFHSHLSNPSLFIRHTMHCVGVSISVYLCIWVRLFCRSWLCNWYIFIQWDSFVKQFPLCFCYSLSKWFTFDHQWFPHIDATLCHWRRKRGIIFVVGMKL